MKKFVCLLFGMVLTAAITQGAVVTLKNGERLVGSWETVQNGTLTFKSSVAGEVTIPVSKIRSFKPSKSVVIVRNDGTTVRGQIELLPSGDWRVTRAGQSQVVPASAIKVIMPEADYTKLVNHQAKLWQDWHGGANAGYAVQSGNQQSSSISASVAATRERPAAPVFFRHFRTTYSLLMLFSHVTQSGVKLTSNTLTTNLREDYLFTPANFVFGFGEVDHIQPSGVYLRQIYGGGLGRDLIHNSRTVFSVLGGITFTNQKLYTTPATQFAELLVGESLSMALTKRISFTHFLNFYPNLTETGQYNFDTTSGLAMKLTSRITANVSFVDNYLSNPALGSKKNNAALTTGIGITF
jgi:putative salt-induced outer membrane protein YdiY